MPLQNLRMRFVDPRPSRAVKFRKFLLSSGPWRPFHLEHIALKTAGIPVAFDGPYVNNLSARLLCLAERPRFPARLVTGLFRELPVNADIGSIDVQFIDVKRWPMIAQAPRLILSGFRHRSIPFATFWRAWFWFKTGAARARVNTITSSGQRPCPWLAPFRDTRAPPSHVRTEIPYRSPAGCAPP